MKGKIMSTYSPDEIEQFRKKDIRISRSGIVQALIQSGVFSKDEIVSGLQVIPIAEMYLRWVWDDKESVRAEDKKNVEKPIEVPCNEGMIDWDKVATTSGYPIPTAKEEEILIKIYTEYRAGNGYDIDATKLLQQVMKKFNKYPSKESSMKIVMESIPLESLI